ncbi:DUF4402 domain-containing protein [Phenylobacterium sp.]|uniref:DUF4402 domain-containing protein n=1 Tax=Phenylobacterium sp. TaxID=1871053 RepID=UPI003D2BA116
MIRPLLVALIAAWALPLAAAAATWTVNVTGPMELGSVGAAVTGDTVFRVDPASGAVSVVSGAGRRLTGGSARVQVDVSCRPSRGVDNACINNNVMMRVGVIGTLSGRARAFTAFNVSMGTASLVSGPTGSNPLQFTLAPVGNNTVRTFFVGADFPVAGDDSGLPSGLGENGFYVYAVDPGGATLAGDADKGKVTAYRSLSLAKTGDLNFGRIQLPTGGSSTISLNPSNGARTVSGNAFAYPTPAPTRGAFTISGEGGQQVSLTIPTTIQMTSNANTLSVNVTSNAQATPRLSGNLGAAGTYDFAVGGNFSITPTTPVGSYSGILTVSVDYN